MRDKNASGNAIQAYICMLIHNHKSRFEVKVTHYERVTKKIFGLSVKTERPEFKNKVKYSFYYS